MIVMQLSLSSQTLQLGTDLSVSNPNMLANVFIDQLNGVALHIAVDSANYSLSVVRYLVQFQFVYCSLV